MKLMKFDQDDFTNVGPGASIGIRLIFPSLKKGEQEKGIYILRDMAKGYLEKNGNFKYIDWDFETNNYKIVKPKEGKITLHQIEMWLCEFQKYGKMKIGEGKQRSVFSPQTEQIYITKD